MSLGARRTPVARASARAFSAAATRRGPAGDVPRRCRGSRGGRDRPGHGSCAQFTLRGRARSTPPGRERRSPGRPGARRGGRPGAGGRRSPRRSGAAPPGRRCRPGFWMVGLAALSDQDRADDAAGGRAGDRRGRRATVRQAPSADPRATAARSASPARRPPALSSTAVACGGLERPQRGREAGAAQAVLGDPEQRRRTASPPGRRRAACRRAARVAVIRRASVPGWSVEPPSDELRCRRRTRR